MKKQMSSDEVALFKNYQAKNRIRFVSATALFDGHDASINIFRRLLQNRGAELIHLGHNRTALEVVRAAIQEDVQAIALSSYQGGHMEYFKYVRELLDQQGGQQIKIFGGGGGVITPEEIQELETHGVSKIFSPEDGQILGLDGIIGYMLQKADFSYEAFETKNHSGDSLLARCLTLAEKQLLSEKQLPDILKNKRDSAPIPVIGITGTGGAGKSSLTDELLLRLLFDFKDMRIGLICIDPTKKKTGGALLGDRIRINASSDPRVFLRSFASRDSGKELATVTSDAIKVLKQGGMDLIVVETSGIGQGDTGIINVSDLSLYVMTPEYGAQTQLEKIDMLDFADFVVVNKLERAQGLDAVRDVRTQMRRTRFKGEPLEDNAYPIFGTIASRFNDDGVNALYHALVKKIATNFPNFKWQTGNERPESVISSHREALIPANKSHYLSQIAATVRSYHKKSAELISHVKKAESLEVAAHVLESTQGSSESEVKHLRDEAIKNWEALPPHLRGELENWPKLYSRYQQEEFTYDVRGRAIKAPSLYKSITGEKYPKISLPQFKSKAELASYLLKENTPGAFPYTAGIFPFRRQGEDPKRQFAGEGGPTRTNQRFHYLCANDDAKRLSTAFDSVTLYGSDPDKRPDIYGKIGESGVSIATLDDMKELYKGFDLCAPSTSVSMTINGPAPIILAMFLNTAVDQQIDIFNTKNGRAPTPSEHQKIYDETLQIVRGTVQADILKEDQAQNTCIFSTEFALKMMADIQEYFIEKKVRNYYSVSISGYHIAEAGANPITQLAFTLANGFTYVEYYLARGFSIDDFAPNLSFFFSNGLDPEYTVIGRVARRIWAIAMRDFYQASERSQKLKYHIQTSGRSLHAMEMDFNDIRTTLQGLLALVDNCNSLHTNAYDEALTTPTEESVRRAMAIQLIINKEFGLNKCENALQGSYYAEALTDAVEAAVLTEFDNLSKRSGVLGAMESQYQRSKIQEESLYYEHQKHDGTYPIVGVNTYINPKGSTEARSTASLIRATYDEKDDQLQRLKSFKTVNAEKKQEALSRLCSCVIKHQNVFAELMHTVRFASLGEITEALYSVGGKYRRSM